MTFVGVQFFQDAVAAARESFREISDDSDVVFESNELQWFKYYRTIEPDEWERPEFRNFVWKVEVTEVRHTVGQCVIFILNVCH